MKLYKLVRTYKRKYVVVIDLKTYKSIGKDQSITFIRLVSKPFWRDFAGGFRVL